MAKDDDWLDSDRWLSDAEWLELERCSLEWLDSGERQPAPAQLARLEPLVQRLLEFTLSSGREHRKYVHPPGGMYRLTLDSIQTLYESEVEWQECLTRDCDRMLRPYRTHEARLLTAIRACDPGAPIGSQLRGALRVQLKNALLRAAQAGARAMLEREAPPPDFDLNRLADEDPPHPSSDDARDGCGSAVAPKHRQRACDQAHEDTPRSSAIDLASIKRLEYTMAGLLNDDERKPCVLAAIEELDRESRERADMAPPALLFLDDFRCRKLSGFALNVALSLKLFVGYHRQTRQVVTLREACSALRRRAEAISRSSSIPIATAFDSMNQPALWDVVDELGVQVEVPNTMTVRLKRARRRLLERVLTLVNEARKAHYDTRPVTVATDRPNKGGDHS